MTGLQRETPSWAGARPGGRRHLDVERVTTVEGLERLAPEWRALSDRVPEALPFATPEWATSWWTHLRRQSGMTRDALRVYVVRDAVGVAVGIAPLMLTTYRVLGAPIVRILQPIGADPNITEVRGMLVAPEDEAAVVAALRSHLEQDRGGRDWVNWYGLRRGGEAAASLAAAPRALLGAELPTFVLPIAGTWEDFRRSRPRNIRESLRKCYNSLARDGHEWSFRVLESEADVLAALPRFVDLHGRRAATESSVSHPDYFSAAQPQRFLLDVMRRFAERGAARVFQLEVGGQAVAMRLGLRFGSRLYLYYSGFDPAWGKYSVMTTVVAETLRHAHESGVSLVNLSSGADVSKLRWRPDEVAYVDRTVIEPGVRSRLAHRAFIALLERSGLGRHGGRPADEAPDGAPDRAPGPLKSQAEATDE